MTPEQLASLLGLLSYLKDAGAFGGLVYLLWQLQTGRLITRHHHDAVVADRDVQIVKGEAREAEWKRVALGNTDALAEMTPLVRTRRRGDTGEAS